MKSSEFQAWFDLVAHLPRETGIYSVWSSDKLLYIGTSDCLRDRLRMHIRRREFVALRADIIRYFLLDDKNDLRLRSQRYEMERFLIRRNRPLLNVMAKDGWYPLIGKTGYDGVMVQ